MGFYINPEDGTSKEEFLEKHGLRIEHPTWPSKPGTLPVCLVNNRSFTAAGIVFNDPSDHRPKRWYVVPIEALKPFLPERYHNT